MLRTQLFFLNACGVSQQLISRQQVACLCGAFRPLEQVTSVLLFSHRVLRDVEGSHHVRATYGTALAMHRQGVNLDLLRPV